MKTYSIKDSDLKIIPTKTKFTEEGIRKKLITSKFELKDGVWTLNQGQKELNQTQRQIVGMFFGYNLLLE